MEPSVDAATIPVAAYDEDPDESFEGPGGLVEFFNEDIEEDYYDESDVDQYDEADPLEASAPQRVSHREATHAVSGSAHTHFLSTHWVGPRLLTSPSLVTKSSPSHSYTPM